jgi:predicted RND superfamily exporter protein
MLARLAGSRAYRFDEIPFIMRDRFFPLDPERKGCLVYATLRRDIWKPEVYDRVNEYVVPKFPELTGAALLSHKIVDLVIQRGAWGLITGSIVCLVLMFIFLKSVVKGLTGFVPIIIAFLHTGFVFWLGTVIARPLLNYISITSLILIAGIGLDYSIHSLSASAANRFTVMKSVFVSGCTSLIGFAGLWFCGHAGLQGLGLALVMGLSVCIGWSLSMLVLRKGA